MRITDNKNVYSWHTKDDIIPTFNVVIFLISILWWWEGLFCGLLSYMKILTLCSYPVFLGFVMANIYQSSLLINYSGLEFSRWKGDINTISWEEIEFIYAFRTHVGRRPQSDEIHVILKSGGGRNLGGQFTSTRGYKPIKAAVYEYSGHRCSFFFIRERIKPRKAKNNDLKKAREK